MLKNADLQRLLEGDGNAEEGNVSVEEVEDDSAIQRVTPKEEATEAEEVILCDGAVRTKIIKRSLQVDSRRIGDGCSIAYRGNEEDPLTEVELGSVTLPWALEITSRRIRVGDVVEVVATGEHALADDEVFDPKAVADERRWCFEIATVRGTVQDKFRLTVDERITLANELRERGNGMMKQGRLLRACDYYERGSSFMDVIEAEDLGMPGSKKDAKAVANNARLKECQQPLLLNWALALMRRKMWHDAERKCSEVILDIDASCVKALFRRGQCQVQLGNLEDAKKDLLKARDLDTSIADEVEKELVKLRRHQKALDQKDRSWAQKAFQTGAIADERSKESKKSVAAAEDDMDCHIKETSKARLMPSREGGPPPTGASLVEVLAAQEKAASEGQVDDVTYARQREAIYNQFIMAGRSAET